MSEAAKSLSSAISNLIGAKIALGKGAPIKIVEDAERDLARVIDLYYRPDPQH